MEQTRTVMEITNLSKTINKSTIIKNIDLTIQAGEYIAIMGPSGAGKSTFLNLISGLDNPTAGSIKILDAEIAGMKDRQLTKFRCQHIGFIFQNYNLVQYLSVKDNILLPQKLQHHKPTKTQYQTIVQQTGLSDLQSHKPYELSGGQQQRVSIARAVIGNNHFIFGDEPTGALDLWNRDQIIDLLKQMSSQYHKTLVVVTHDPQVAASADRVVFLLNGEISGIYQGLSAEQLGHKLLELENYVKNQHQTTSL